MAAATQRADLARRLLNSAERTGSVVVFRVKVGEHSNAECPSDLQRRSLVADPTPASLLGKVLDLERQRLDDGLDGTGDLGQMPRA